eukprot:UN00152
MSVRPTCSGGCGFYGSKDTKNYCSLCFKKMYPEEAFALAKKQPNTVSNDKNQNTECKQEPNYSNSNDKYSNKKQKDTPKRKIQKKKNRCWNCRKKLTLAAQFKCKCGYVFCSMHRYHDAHDCDYDWKTQHTKNLESNNPEISASKVPPMS